MKTTKLDTGSRLDPNLARRATGAMFLFAFGSVWLELYAINSEAAKPFTVTSIAIISVLLLFFAYRRYKRHQPALLAEPSSPERKRAERIFRIVNAVQWLAIFIVANLLSHLGLAHWIIPAIIFIVGLHFLPLAYALANAAHYVTGAALMILSIVYPLLASSGPASFIGCLGAGLILWCSAIWALSANSLFNRTSPHHVA